MQKYLWTDCDFEKMSWHDNHVHGFQIEEGNYGAGKLLLNIDYILEWIHQPDDSYQFLIIPSILEFNGVTNLRFSLNYATPTAGLSPFSIDAIKCTVESREQYEAKLWKILVNWPVGEISFEADGYTQRGMSEPKLSDEQWLSPEQRVNNF